MEIRSSMAPASSGVSRRTFLELGGTALLSIPAAGHLVERPALAEEAAASAAAPEAEEGEWKPFRCMRIDCSGSCINYALVKDGQVVRIKTDDRFEDSEEFRQQRGCVRGQARRSLVYGPDHLKYPMKRRHWEPGGGDKSLRGKDEWVRISWDEALDIVASELKRIVDTYGNESIYRGQYVNSVLAAMCGSWATSGGNSLGGWIYPALYMTGFPNLDCYYNNYLYNDRLDWLSSKLIVLFGNNPAWSCHGYPNKILLDAKRRGAKIIGVNPYCNETISTLADQWIAVRPATDAALMIACAYVMIDKNLQDQDFLDRCCSGFDAEHMPEGSDPKDNFKDYVLGTYDGVPKTLEWASEICGVEPDVIEAFAVEMATTKPAAILTCSAVTRAFRGEQVAQAFFTLGWMTGNVGKPGAMVSDCSQKLFGNGGQLLCVPGPDGKPALRDPLCNSMDIYGSPMPQDGLFGIPAQGRWEAVLNDGFQNGKWGWKDLDIRMIWDIGRGNKLNTEPGTLGGIKAYRKVEFVVAADIALNTSAQYADVVLPSVAQWEYPANFSAGTNRESLTYCAQVIEPLFEGKSDTWINMELAKRLGIDPASIELPEEEVFLNQLQGAQVMKEDGTGFETMFTVTAQDWAELGDPSREPQTGRMEWQEFKRTGMFQLKREPGDNYGYIALKDFVEDPEANPVATESGKLEIYCPKLVEAIDCFGSDSIAPVAQYVPPTDGYEATYEDFEARVCGEYPLQLITPHSQHHNSTQLDNVRSLKEAFPQPVFMNPIDAEARGLAHGDPVKVYNQRGAFIRHLKVTEREVPGCVMTSDGGWTTWDDELQVDLGGNPNVLTSTESCGTDIQPWNTVVVEIEKWDGPIQHDHERPQRVIDYLEA